LSKDKETGAHAKTIGEINEHMTRLVILAAHVQANGYYMLDVSTFGELEFVCEFEMAFCNRNDIIRKTKWVLVVA